MLRAFEVSQRLANSDSLTGLVTRRSLEAEVRNLQESGSPYTVAYGDLDHFKQLNDVFGHEAGDQLLQGFVTRTEECLRGSSDWLARVGGDEFVVVLPETRALGANRVADKLRRAYAQSPMTTHAAPISFTVSVGVIAVEAAHEIESVSKIEQLLRAADRGLYASKSLGGNRVSTTTVATLSAPNGDISKVKNETH